MLLLFVLAILGAIVILVALPPVGRSALRSRWVRLSVESLEVRLNCDIEVWTGAGNGTWSDPHDWSRGYVPNINTEADFTAQYNVPSVVDQGFNGPVGIVHIFAGYTQDLYLGTNLSVNTTFQDGGIIAGPGQYFATTLFDWTGGTMTNYGSGAGNTVIGPNATLRMETSAAHNLDNRALLDYGITNWTLPQSAGGSLTITQNGLFDNMSGANLNLLSNGTYTVNGDGTGIFENDGSVLFPSGGASLVISASSVTSGAYNETDNSVLDLKGPATLNTSASFVGTGTVTAESAVMLNGNATMKDALNATNANFVGKNGALDVQGLFSANNVTMQGPGKVVLDGVSPFAGRMLIAGPLFINNGFSLDNNSGGITWSSGDITLNGGTIDNEGTMLVGIQSDGKIAGTGTLINEANGTINEANAAGTTVYVYATLNNYGTLFLGSAISFAGSWADAGTISDEGGALTVNGMFTILQNGKLVTVPLGPPGTNPAPISVGSLVNQGAIDMRDGQAETLHITGLSGVQNTGNYTQSSTGAIYMDLDNPTGPYDKFVVDGSAQLGGALSLDFINNFTPQGQDPIYWNQLISYASLVNNSNFASLIPPPNVPGVWNANYGPMSVSVSWRPSA